MDNEIYLVTDGVGQHHLPQKFYRHDTGLIYRDISYVSDPPGFHMYEHEDGRWVISNLLLGSEVCAYAESMAMHPGTVYAGEWYILDPTTLQWPAKPHPTFKFAIAGPNTEQKPFHILDLGVDYFSRRVKCPSGPIWYKHFQKETVLFSKGKAGCFQFCPCRMTNAYDLENLCYTASSNFVTQHLKDRHMPPKPQNVRVAATDAAYFTIEWDAEEWKSTMLDSKKPIGLCVQQNVDGEMGNNALVWRPCTTHNLYTFSPELRGIRLPYTKLAPAGQAYRFRVSALVTVPLSVWDDNKRPGAPSTWSEASGVLERSGPTLAEVAGELEPVQLGLLEPYQHPEANPSSPNISETTAALHYDTDGMDVDDDGDAVPLDGSDAIPLDDGDAIPHDDGDAISHDDLEAIPLEELWKNFFGEPEPEPEPEAPVFRSLGAPLAAAPAYRSLGSAPAAPPASRPLSDASQTVEAFTKSLLRYPTAKLRAALEGDALAKLAATKGAVKALKVLYSYAPAGSAERMLDAVDASVRADILESIATVRCAAPPPRRARVHRMRATPAVTADVV